MSISVGPTSAFVGAYGYSAGSTYTPTIPAGQQAGDLMFLFSGNKTTATYPTVSGWTQLMTQTNGSVASGAGTGSVRQTVFYRVHTGGTQPEPYQYWNGMRRPNVSGFLSLRSDVTDEFTIDYTHGADTNASNTSVSATGGAQLDYSTGDYLAVFVMAKDEGSAGVDQHSSKSVTIPGCTLGTLTTNLFIATSIDYDAYAAVLTAPINSGSATGVPTYTATAAGTSTSDPQVVFLRIAEPAQAPAFAGWGVPL